LAIVPHRLLLFQWHIAAGAKFFPNTFGANYTQQTAEIRDAVIDSVDSMDVLNPVVNPLSWNTTGVLSTKLLHINDVCCLEGLAGVVSLHDEKSYKVSGQKLFVGSHSFVLIILYYDLYVADCFESL
jgi:hypothetical protein